MASHSGLSAGAAVGITIGAEYRCARCQYVLGITTDRQLDLGRAIVRSRTVVTCPQCSYKSNWRPGKKS